MPSLLHTGYMQTKLGMQWMELKWPSKKVCLVQGGGGGGGHLHRLISDRGQEFWPVNFNVDCLTVS